MKIDIWAKDNPDVPEHGPYRMLDTVERPDLYLIGEITHYGPVLLFLPLFASLSGDVNQSVVVKLDPASISRRPVESVNAPKEGVFSRIRFFPILADPFEHLTRGAPLAESYTILPDKDLTVENISRLITPETFAVWKRDCFLSKAVVNSLENLDYAIVHRYSSEFDRDGVADSLSLELVNLAVACLSLIRPTRRGHAGVIAGLILEGEVFQPQQFSLNFPSEVPPVQRLFAVRPRDVELLRSVLPEFLQLYVKSEIGSIKPEYEPLRMAVQLYEQAYTVHYWKARHILWWAAIEALFGNAEDAVIARVYAIFGDGSLSKGFERSIYERMDVPTSFQITPGNDHKLGEVLPLIYDVRNFSAKVPHPLDGSAPLLDVLAEAATFIIRKTIIGLLNSGERDEFKDRETRDKFWLYRYGLDNRQSTKRLRELKALKSKA
jgi:hypothetical protein